jgi:formyl transferase-like protein
MAACSGTLSGRAICWASALAVSVVLAHATISLAAAEAQINVLEISVSGVPELRQRAAVNADGEIFLRPARRIVDFVRASNFFPFRSPWGVPRTRRGDSTLGIFKAQLTGTPVDAPPGTVGTARSGGIEVSCADEWILVRQVFREGKCIPAREALKAGDRLADWVNTPASKP